MQPNKTKAIFLDRDGVINDDTHFITRPADFHLFPFTAKAISMINQSEYLAIVITNQSAVARGFISEIQLAEIHQKMKTDLVQNKAYLDAIYYCPHHPEIGKITNCNCRKPLPGMLFQAAHDFPINLSESYMIGDNERDIIAGKKAGCKTIGVHTGKGLKDAETLPDYMKNDLMDAIEFILNQ